VGINDYAEDEILIYPNPAQDMVYIQSGKPIMEVDIINNLGQTVASSENTNSVNVYNLATGIYHIVIKTNDNIFIKPLYINK
jgi:hypothetical protein